MGNVHYKWQFSIAMLVHQRVAYTVVMFKCDFLSDLQVLEQTEKGHLECLWW